MTEEILTLCKAMGAGEDKEELLGLLVQAAERTWSGRLRRGVTPADCGAAFPLAVAMTAVDELEQATGGGQVSEFTAGDVTVRKTAGDASLRMQAARLLAPWLGDTGFAFTGVDG
jgi:hypothetical protein